MKSTRRKSLGSTFDSWLEEQGEEFRAEVMAGVIKRQLVEVVRRSMKKRGMGVNALQRLLSTGPSQVQRLLDPEDIGISLKSMVKALSVLGVRGRLTFGGEKQS